ncbi:MAG: hypothetical protein HZA22_08635 [Nitrospirae bacterium]|nr:hypothetical protein [Nitrospirota bacterium]MBI5695278.1 hypothetical protein [Nitrospirota bacterium]
MEKRRRSHHVLTWKIAFYLLIGLAASNAVFYLVMSRPLGGSYARALYILKDTRDTSLGQAAAICLALFVMFSALVFVASLLMSHRVSGPVYRFEKTAESLRGGDFSVDVRLRRLDEMSDVAEEMDKAVKAVRARLAKADALAEELGREAVRLEKAAASGPGADRAMAEALPRMSDGLREIRETVNRFRV